MRLPAFLILALLALFSTAANAQKVSDLPNASIPLSGAELLSLTQGGVSVKTAVSNIASLANSLLKTAAFVPNNAALIALPAIPVPFTSAVRLGVTVAGDASPQVFVASGSACTLNAGAGDVGLQVPSANGNCWIAVFSNPEGVDPREWGNIGTSDDTVIWQTIDATMGNVAWPAQEPKTVIVPAISTPVANLTFANIQRITGTPRITELTCSSAMATASGPCWAYIGNGPLRIDDLVIGCLDAQIIPGHIVEPPNCGDTIFEVHPATPTSYPIGIVTRNVDLIGGQNQFSTYQTQSVDLEFDRVYDAYGFGVIVSIQNLEATGGENTGGNLSQASHSRIVIKDCRNPADYCLSLPVDFPPSGSTYSGPWITPGDLFFDVHCIGAGFLGSKGCIDATGNAAEKIHGKLVAYNANVVGIESKTGNISTTAIPPVFRDRYFDIDQTQSVDVGGCALFDNEISTASPPGGTAIMKNLTAHINCNFSQPRPWAAGFYQEKGDVFGSTNGRSYIVLQDGIAGSVPPSDETESTAIVDGTSLVLCTCHQVLPYSAGTTGVVLENINGADLYITSHDMTVALTLRNRGETNTIENVNVRIDGTAEARCIDDTLFTLNNLNGINDNITFDGHCRINDNSAASAGPSGPAAIMIGAGDGTHANNYTNLTIRGDWLTPAAGFGPSQSYALRTVAGSTIQGSLIGAHLSGYTFGMILLAASNLNINGGLYETTGGSNAGGVIRASGAAATGTITVSPSAAFTNSASATDPDFENASGATVVMTGVLYDPPSAASPTAKCGIGEVAPKTVTAGLWGCTATNTWGSLY